MYKLTEYVDSIEEINEGKLFDIKDFSFGHVNYKGSILKIPQTEYEMFAFYISKIDPSKCIFDQIKFAHPVIITGDYVSKEYSYKKIVNESENSRFEVPVFNDKTTYAIFNKCNKAYLYYKSSKFDFEIIKEHYFYNWSNFYPGLMACKRAIDTYKEVIDEILPLFEESAREQVKAIVYRGSIRTLIQHACDFMEYIKKDIAKHINEYANYTTHPEAISSWENSINMVSALLVEIYAYVEIADRYSYKESLVKQKAGVQHYESVPDSLSPDKPAYIKEHIELYKKKIKPVKDKLENFYKLKPKGMPIINVETNEAALVLDLQNNTKIFINKPPRAIVWAVNFFLSTQDYISALYYSVSHVRDEKVPLLGELKNYSPIYQAPKAPPVDKSIDQLIILREKNLFLKVETVNVTDILSVTEFVKECCDALNIIRMRYSLSLSTINNSYFNMFETYSEYDKKTYCLIIESYIEKIMVKCINATINSIIEEKNNSSMIDLELQKSNIKKLLEIIKSVQVYLYNPENRYPKSTKMLEDLIDVAKNAPNAEHAHILDAAHEHPTGLHRRYVRVSP